MNLQRTLDAALLNKVANDPDVRPMLGGSGDLDLRPMISDLNNIALQADGGGFILEMLEPGIFEVHSLFLPNARSQTVTAMRAGMDFMFCETSCFRLVTQLPDNNRPAAALARAGGFTPMFRREHAARGPTTFAGLDLDTWVFANADLEAEGESFHRLLERAKAIAGSDRPTHEHDPAHDRAVGAAVRMIKCGNVEKGVVTYNRWARFARYAPITIASRNPLILNVGDALVSVVCDNMEIIKCL